MLFGFGTLALLPASSSDASKLQFWAAVGAAAGVFLFVRGFIMLRYKRQIVNTPFSKIRSASMGLVEVSGAAKGPLTIPAGLTGEACYYYRAMAWQLRQSGKNRNWQKVADESLYVPFFVEDPTGRLLIDPQGANLDLQRNFKDEIGGSFFSGSDMTPENVAGFLNRNGISGSERTRLEEYCVKPDNPLFVFGTLCPNASRAAWTAAPHTASARSSLDFRFNFFGPTGTEALRSLGFIPALTVRSTTMAGSSTDGSAPSSDSVRGTPNRPVAPAGAAWSSVSMDEECMSSSTVAAATIRGPESRPAVRGNMQQISSSVVAAEPDQALETSATAVQTSADELDLQHQACISKGANKDPFMISWRSQRQVVQSLAWKSALCIWGGPALALACFYFLAVALGWT
jgi:hypothetical protein